MMVGADLAVAAFEQGSQYVRAAGIRRNRMGDDVGRPDAVSGKQVVQARERVDVLEPLVRARCGIPLIVPLRIDADEQEQPGGAHHRS
jgi:hypothetical protein